MNDDQVTNSNTAGVIDDAQPLSPPSSPSGDPASSQDPLAILETILQDAKAKSGQKKAGVAGADDAVPEIDPAAQLAAEAELEALKQEAIAEEARRAAEMEALRQQQIAEQKALISQALPQTPEYLARKEQESEEQQITAAQNADGDGFEITQLSRTKIPIAE